MSVEIIETRQVANDYTLHFENKLYQIARASVCAGLRGGAVSMEKRLDGTLAVRFRDRYLTVNECLARPKAAAVQPVPVQPPKTVHRKSGWMKNFHLGKNDPRRKTFLR